MPDISIVIPTYNRADMLARALRSVQEQTEQNWECVIVDDGSTDQTQQIINTFQDPRFHAIYQANQGPSTARNNGIRASSGKYITFLDSDDQMLPEKISLHLHAFHTDQTLGLIASGWREFDQEGNFLQDRAPWFSSQTLNLMDWLNGCPVIGSAITVKKEWLDSVGYFDPGLPVAEDYDLWLRLSLAGCKMAWYPEYVCIKTIHSKGISRQYQAYNHCLSMIFDRFFSTPNLPSEVANKRSEVYTRVYLENTGRALAAGDVSVAQEHLKKVLHYNPRLVDGDLAPLLDHIASMTLADFVVDRERYLRAWVSMLKDNPYGLRYSYHYLESFILAIEAFDHWRRSEKKEARMKAFKALIRNIDWVKNRGLISLLLKV